MSDLISRQEAIKAINKRMNKVLVDRPDVAFGLCVAAGVLHDMPPASQSQDGDRAVSLNAVLKCLKSSNLKKFDFIEDAREQIKQLPPVTPSDEEMAMQYQRGYIDGFKEGKATFEPKTGHWIDEEVRWKCSECDWWYRDWKKFKFCPNCGSYNGGDDNADRD